MLNAKAGTPPVTAAPREVSIGTRPLERFRPVIGERRMAEVESAAQTARSALSGRTIWHVNSTATGGGVAEILRSILPYVRGAGVQTRWLVIQGDKPFFRVTKRIHHALHGSPGDGSPLVGAAREAYEETLKSNLAPLRNLVQPGDPVILHDPQTAGLIPYLKSHGATVIWRCHIGSDLSNEQTALGWAFLGSYLDGADAFVFSRRQYVPEFLADRRIEIIAPSLDPFAMKNQELSDSAVRAILVHVGILEGPDGEPAYPGEDGDARRVQRQADVMRLGRAPRADRPLVLQVSRWDPLKDHAGVMAGFVRLLDDRGTEADLVLAGPNVHGVADDPEQAAVLDDLIQRWRLLEHSARCRVHLACLPTADAGENATIVNALQRHAAVVVQKSLAEGFGLTVTEAMWKRRPVIASAVGGILDQIEDGRSGLLLQDPLDSDAFAGALRRLLQDGALARRLGETAQERVRDRYLITRELVQYAGLVAGLVSK